MPNYKFAPKSAPRRRSPRSRAGSPAESTRAPGPVSERTECAGCEEWWRLHSLLHKELGAKLYPAPRGRHLFPEGSPAAKAWKPDLKAQARWRALEAALEMIA